MLPISRVSLRASVQFVGRVACCECTRRQTAPEIMGKSEWALRDSDRRVSRSGTERDYTAAEPSLPPLMGYHGDARNLRSTPLSRSMTPHLLAAYRYRVVNNMLRWGKRDSVQADKWTPIAPSAPSGSTSRFASVLKPSKPSNNGTSEIMVGRWPETVLLRIVSYLPVPDLPAVSRVNRSFARIVRAEPGWEARCNFLRIKPERMSPSHAQLIASAEEPRDTPREACNASKICQG